jgi:PHP family Zn ribbon phosphoesterase
MKEFRADIHIHTLLSPCGDLEMSPANIVQRASLLGLDILGIADHNSTKHAPLIKKLAEEKGIFTLCGAEVTTKEEVHCLAFFENESLLKKFQSYLDEHLPDIKNDPKYFGYQVVTDEEEMITEEVDKLLISAIGQTIDQVQQKVCDLSGIFIPAHIDRSKFSLTSQLGFVPPDIKADAFEVSVHSSKEKMLKMFPYLQKFSFVRGSDAHYIEHLGSSYSLFRMEEITFEEIRKALHQEEGRGAWYKEKPDTSKTE